MDVSLELGGRPVLQAVTLGVRPGEVVALIGPNGAGKSSLLHVLSGAVEPGAGAATLDGRPLPHWPRRTLARRRAVLAQSTVLTFPFRVVEVVLLGRSPHAGHAGRAADAAAAQAAMAAADVLHLADRVYTTLSGGERQRVQLARVLAQLDGGGAGRYLLLDEPTNNLDMAHQQSIMATLRRLAADGCGILAVLHDPNLASLAADRIVVLAGGRVAAEGPPEAVLDAPTFRAAFGLAVTVVRHPVHGRPVVLPG